jgi:HEPN domain
MRTISDMISELVTEPANRTGILQTFGFPVGEALHLLFREGVYWLHKALHVLGAAEIDADGGMPTWSLSSAYQSAFFSARSSMAFLGVAIAERAKTSYVVEFCRDMRTMSAREYGLAAYWAAQMLDEITSRGADIEHV